MKKDIKLLYRKVNRNTHHCFHNGGPDAKYDRNTKNGLKKTMRSGVKHGLDYTPLYMFLLSKIGQNWDMIYSEVTKRLKGGDINSIYHLIKKDNKKPIVNYVTCGESSKYSLLFIDENNLLQKYDPELTNEKIYPSCPCCTHTFNGKVLVNKFQPENVMKNIK